MQEARLRHHSASDTALSGDWEEISSPDEVRSIGSSSSEDEIIIFPPCSPRINELRSESSSTAVTSTTATLEIIVSPSTPSPTSSSVASAASTPVKSSSAASSGLETLLRSVASYAQKPINVPLPAEPTDSKLSPIEKTLLHQISRLSEELEVSKQKNEILEQTIHRDDFGMFGDDEEGSSYLRLGLKTFGFFVLLTVIQRKLIVSGLVSIFGAAVVGGLLTYEQEAASRRRRDN